MKKMSKKDQAELKRIEEAEKSAAEAMLSMNFEDFKKETVNTFRELTDELGNTINWCADERMKLAKTIGQVRQKEHDDLVTYLDTLVDRIAKLEQLLYMQIIAYLGHIDPRQPVTNEQKETFARLLGIDLKVMAATFKGQPDNASARLM